MTLKSCLLAIALFTVALTLVSGAAGRPMTIDDLITAVRVGEPDLSPDGRSVAYVRTTTNGQTGKRNPDLWSAPADGSTAPRLLLGGESPETTPLYSPDGKSLAFISVHDDGAQIYVMPSEGGRLRQVTKLKMGAQAPMVFSPDGTRIAFVSDVYPECADEACNARRAEAAEMNPKKTPRRESQRFMRPMLQNGDEKPFDLIDASLAKERQTMPVE